MLEICPVSLDFPLILARKAMEFYDFEANLVRGDGFSINLESLMLHAILPVNEPVRKHVRIQVKFCFGHSTGILTG